MATAIFVNLPVSDLERSKAFFTALGYTINPQFSDGHIWEVMWMDPAVASGEKMPGES